MGMGFTQHAAKRRKLNNGEAEPSGESLIRNGLETGPETSDLSWAEPTRPVGRILASCWI